MRLAIADTLKAQEMEFQFTHPGKGATETQGLNSLPVRFQFTHPGKGATPNDYLHSAIKEGFNSRTLGRVRHDKYYIGNSSFGFQFTHPGKGATAASPYTISEEVFQFTHPGKGATPCTPQGNAHPAVSIHAPWEGCD